MTLCKESAWLHTKYSEYIYELAKEASITGEPIVRYMEYEFPNEGLEKVKDQFMLGNKYLVAPVTKKGFLKRKVSFPKGKWLGEEENYIEGPTTIEVKSPLNKILIFENKEI